MSDEIDDTIKDVGSGTSIVILGSISVLFFGYIAKAIYTRSLGPEKYGVLVQGLGIAETFSILAVLGLNSAVPRFMKFGESSNKYQALKSSFIISFPVSIITAVAIYLAAPMIIPLFFDSQNLPRVIQFLSITIPLSVMRELLIGYFRGIKKASPTVVSRDILHPLSELFLVLLLIQGSLTLWEAVGATLGAWVISSTASVFLFKRYGDIKRTANAETNILDLFSFCLPLFLVAVFSQTTKWFDVLMLGWLKTNSGSGIYEATFAIAAIVPLLMMTTRYMLLPSFSELISEDDLKGFRKLYSFWSRWLIIGTLPIFGGFFVLSEQVLTISFGRSFAQGSVALSILSLAGIFEVLTGPNNSVLLSAGETDQLMFGEALGFTANIALNLALIPKLGVLGAALAFLAGVILTNAYTLIKVYAKYKASPMIKNPLALLLSFTIPTFCLILAEYILGLSPVQAVLSGLVYVFLYFLMLINSSGTNQDDIDKLCEILESFGVGSNFLKDVVYKLSPFNERVGR